MPPCRFTPALLCLPRLAPPPPPVLWDPQPPSLSCGPSLLRANLQRLPALNTIYLLSTPRPGSSFLKGALRSHHWLFFPSYPSSSLPASSFATHPDGSLSPLSPLLYQFQPPSPLTGLLQGLPPNPAPCFPSYSPIVHSPVSIQRVP